MDLFEAFDLQQRMSAHKTTKDETANLLTRLHSMQWMRQIQYSTESKAGRSVGDQVPCFVPLERAAEEEYFPGTRQNKKSRLPKNAPPKYKVVKLDEVIPKEKDEIMPAGFRPSAWSQRLGTDLFQTRKLSLTIGGLEDTNEDLQRAVHESLKTVALERDCVVNMFNSSKDGDDSLPTNNCAKEYAKECVSSDSPQRQSEELQNDIGVTKDEHCFTSKKNEEYSQSKYERCEQNPEVIKITDSPQRISKNQENDDVVAKNEYSFTSKNHGDYSRSKYERFQQQTGTSNSPQGISKEHQNDDGVVKNEHRFIPKKDVEYSRSKYNCSQQNSKEMVRSDSAQQLSNVTQNYDCIAKSEHFLPSKKHVEFTQSRFDCTQRNAKKTAVSDSTQQQSGERQEDDGVAKNERFFTSKQHGEYSHSRFGRSQRSYFDRESSWSMKHEEYSRSKYDRTRQNVNVTEMSGSPPRASKGQGHCGVAKDVDSVRPTRQEQCSLAGNDYGKRNGKVIGRSNSPQRSSKERRDDDFVMAKNRYFFMSKKREENSQLRYDCARQNEREMGQQFSLQKPSEEHGNDDIVEKDADLRHKNQKYSRPRYECDQRNTKGPGKPELPGQMLSEEQRIDDGNATDDVGLKLQKVPDPANQLSPTCTEKTDKMQKICEEMQFIENRMQQLNVALMENGSEAANIEGSPAAASQVGGLRYSCAGELCEAESKKTVAPPPGFSDARPIPREDCVLLDAYSQVPISSEVPSTPFTPVSSAIPTPNLTRSTSVLIPGATVLPHLQSFPNQAAGHVHSGAAVTSAHLSGEGAVVFVDSCGLPPKQCVSSTPRAPVAHVQSQSVYHCPDSFAFPLKQCVSSLPQVVYVSNSSTGAPVCALPNTVAVQPSSDSLAPPTADSCAPAVQPLCPAVYPGTHPVQVSQQLPDGRIVSNVSGEQVMMFQPNVQPQIQQLPQMANGVYSSCQWRRPVPPAPLLPLVPLLPPPLGGGRPEAWQLARPSPSVPPQYESDWTISADDEARLFHGLPLVPPKTQDSVSLPEGSNFVCFQDIPINCSGPVCAMNASPATALTPGGSLPHPQMAPTAFQFSDDKDYEVPLNMPGFHSASPPRVPMEASVHDSADLDLSDFNPSVPPPQVMAVPAGRAPAECSAPRSAAVPAAGVVRGDAAPKIPRGRGRLRPDELHNGFW